MFNSIIHIDMKTKLSPYTIASNCTDLIDIRDGINEIQNEMKKSFPKVGMFRLSFIQDYQNYRLKGGSTSKEICFT